MEGSENYVGLICVFAGFGGLIGALVTSILCILWEDHTR